MLYSLFISFSNAHPAGLPANISEHERLLIALEYGIHIEKRTHALHARARQQNVWWWLVVVTELKWDSRALVSMPESRSTSPYLVLARWQTHWDTTQLCSGFSLLWHCTNQLIHLATCCGPQIEMQSQFGRQSVNRLQSGCVKVGHSVWI